MSTLGACALLACSLPRLEARQPAGALPLQSSASLDGVVLAMRLFPAADVDDDGAVTRAELRATLARWHTAAAAAGADAVTPEQLATAINAAWLPAGRKPRPLVPPPGGSQPQAAEPATVAAMRAALPRWAPARPRQPRRVLVLARAAGFVHASIPLAAATVEALGSRTGAWSTTITYDAADITADNLRRYDAVFLDSTTGAFLDAKNDAAATTQRRQALLEFVRSGKGLAGIHAATDAYHTETPAEPAAAAAPVPASQPPRAAPRATQVVLAAMLLEQGDRNHDGRLDRRELDALADAWFRTLDTRHSGRLLASDFALFAALVPHASGAAIQPVASGPDRQTGTWPEFNRMIGGYFKWHWLDPQLITVKIDDPASPLTRMFHGRAFDVRDEIYTLGASSWSRDDVHVLTSIDYSKLSAADRALESNPRADHDYGLSWIRREGQGRVFYQALGHSERLYADRALLEHLLAGIQYALGDLPADDAPGTRSARHDR